MEQEDKRGVRSENARPFPSSLDLRGKQSVRATFKLSSRAIDAISVVAAHLGIKQKSLFDQLMDDIRSLNAIAREIERDRFNKLNRVQKTYVLSRRTLTSLEEASRKYKAPRDALVEYSIKRLIPVINEEREKHRKREAVFKEISAYMKEGEKLLRKTEELLGEEDPVFEKFRSAMAVCHNARRSMESFIERGRIIEDF